MCDVWCAMCDVPDLIFFVRSILYESRGDQRYPIWVISDHFNDIPKLIPGGSSMYTISCKASYGPMSPGCTSGHKICPFSTFSMLHFLLLSSHFSWSFSFLFCYEALQDIVYIRLPPGINFVISLKRSEITQMGCFWSSLDS